MQSCSALFWVAGECSGCSYEKIRCSLGPEVKLLSSVNLLSGMFSLLAPTYPPYSPDNV